MSNLGKPKPHSAKEIRQRREKVLILMSKGYNQSDIAKELHTTRNTVMRDLKEINEWTRKGLYDLAKQSLSTMLYSCLIGLNEVEKEAWKLYRNDDNDKDTNRWHKVYALRLLVDICKSKFGMFQSGPALMEVNRLHSELEMIKNNLDNNNKYEYSPARCNNFNNYFSNSNPNSTPTRYEGARLEYERGLRNIEDFRNHNHNRNRNNVRGKKRNDK
jgi:hypothetical protein